MSPPATRIPIEVDSRAIFARAGGVLLALAGLIAPGLTFPLDGAWLSAALVSFAICFALMRPARAAHTQHLTPVIAEIR